MSLRNFLWIIKALKIRATYLFLGLLLLLTGNISCTNPSESYSIINGKLLNHKATTIVLTNNLITDTVFIKNKKHFKYKVLTDSASYINLKYGANIFNLFIFPNNSLSITIDSNNAYFNGNTSEIIHYLNAKSIRYNAQLGSIVKLFKLSPNKFSQTINAYYNEQNSLLNILASNSSKTEAIFFKMEKLNLSYQKFQLLIEYASISPNNYMLPDNYFTFLDDLTINDSRLLKIPSYRYFLYAYIDWLTKKEMHAKGELFAHEITLIKMQLIARNLSSMVKDQLLYNTLNEHIIFKGFKNSELLFKTFEYQCGNKDLKEKLTKPYKKYMELNNGKIAPNIQLVNIHGETKKLSDFKGSYIYIDVWATWCIPCIKEAPFFEALKTKYKHKNVVFLSLSVDKNKPDWLNYCLKSKKTHQQFWVKNSKEFFDNYLIKTIPHFIIIGPDGKIINVNAKRPSNNKNKWLEDLGNKPEV